MRNSILIMGGSHRLSAELLSATMALAASSGVRVLICDVPAPPPIDLDTLIQQFDLPTPPQIEEPFFPRETAYERRNRNAPWFRRFDKKKKRS